MKAMINIVLALLLIFPAVSCDEVKEYPWNDAWNETETPQDQETPEDTESPENPEDEQTPEEPSDPETPSPVVHLKDYVGGKSDNMYELIGIESDGKAPDAKAFEFRPVGYGCQKFEGIFEAAKNSGAKWVIVEQDSPSMGLSPIECAKKSIDYVKTINN